MTNEQLDEYIARAEFAAEVTWPAKEHMKLLLEIKALRAVGEAADECENAANKLAYDLANNIEHEGSFGALEDLRSALKTWHSLNPKVSA